MPRLSSAGRSIAVCAGLALATAGPVLAGSALAAPADALELRPGAASLGGWTPLVLQPNGGVKVVTRQGSGRVVRLSDGGRPAGYVMLGVQFAPRTSVVGRAEVNLARQVLATGRARAVIEIGSGQGVSFEAGVLRTSGGLMWAAWVKRRDGSRDVVTVSRARVQLREWTRVTLATGWSRAAARASLRIDGDVVLRTPPVDLSGVTASRFNVGLGLPGSRSEVGMMYVRRAVAWGPALPAATAAPGQGGQAAPLTSPGVPGTTPTAPATPSTTPPRTTTTPPRTGTTTPTAPRPPTSGVVPRPDTGPQAPPPPDASLPGREIARADFESGTFAGTSSFQAVARDRIQVVSTPVAAGRYAARFEVRSGDNPIGYGDRAELSVDTNEREGQERWYTWATMFDPSFPGGGGFQVVSQFHSRQNGQPPVGFYAENNTYRLQVWPKNADGSNAGRPVTIWSTPIQRGVWYRIVLHVKWSGYDDVGFVELFVNGQPAGRKTYIRTMYPTHGNYFKFGYYRQSGTAQTGVIYHDDFRATQVSP